MENEQVKLCDLILLSSLLTVDFKLTCLIDLTLQSKLTFLSLNFACLIILNFIFIFHNKNNKLYKYHQKYKLIKFFSNKKFKEAYIKNKKILLMEKFYI